MTSRDDWADHLDPEQVNPVLSARERERLDRIGQLLSDPATWDGPPVALRERLLAQATAESAAAAPVEAPGPATTAPAAPSPTATAPAAPGPTATAPAAPSPTATAPAAPTPATPAPGFEPRRQRRGHGARPRRTRWWVPALGTAIATAAAVIAVVVWPAGPTLTPHQLTGTALAPNANATATLETRSAGVAIRLKITGLPPAGPGNYYAAWMRGPQGTVPIGTFHWRVGGIPIDLWSGVDPVRYPELFVTLQRESEAPEPSDRVVLTGRVATQ